LCRGIFVSHDRNGVYSIVYGASKQSLFPELCDVSVAKPLNLQPFLVEGNCPTKLNSSFARVSTEVSEIADIPIAIWGCGSGGAALTEQLVRAGCRKLFIADVDTVEAVNLARTV
jgi:hypothetical protein